MVDAVRAAGGEVFAVTSEPQSLATEAEETWEFGFTSTGDPHHEILQTCRERGWLDLFVNANSEQLRNTRPWTAHPKGYFQPGILAVAAEAAPTMPARVLYRWRCRPTRRNVSGAVERPTPGYTWAQIQARLPEGSEEPALDDTPEMDARPPPWPLFLAMLLAHGWFLKPKVFPLGRANEKPSANPQRMLPRLIGFIAIWIAALVFLPLGWVASAFAVWVALVWRGVATIHREFQNIPEGEPDSA